MEGNEASNAQLQNIILSAHFYHQTLFYGNNFLSAPLFSFLHSQKAFLMKSAFELTKNTACEDSKKFLRDCTSFRPSLIKGIVRIIRSQLTEPTQKLPFFLGKYFWWPAGFCGCQKYTMLPITRLANLLCIHLLAVRADQLECAGWSDGCPALSSAQSSNLHIYEL